MADTIVQCYVDIGGGAAELTDRGGGPSFQEGGPEGVFLYEDHTP